MNRRPRCPPLCARGGHLFSGLLVFLLVTAATRLPAQEAPFSDYFLLGLGWGWILPLSAGIPSEAAVEGIEPGPLLDDLVRAIVIHRTVADRLVIDIDHDSTRVEEGEIFGGANTYSLTWQGDERAPLRSISLGNLRRSIPGSRYLPIDAGGSESLALAAEVRLGPVTLEALARYGSAVEGRRRFRGSRLSVEADLADVAYARARFFLLPDAGIDDAGLKVAKSSPTGPITIDGRRFALLARGTDWKLDNAGARLTLTRALAPGEELAVTYTKGGSARVGDPGLGFLAIIDEDGARATFDTNDGRWDGYFGAEVPGGTRWLFLKREGLASYWELRNTFYLEDLEEGLVPEHVSVQALRTATLAPNPEYDGLVGSFRVSVADAVISFEFSDATGRFYPRPFPGERPFTMPPTGPENNPFHPDNAIYGGPGYAPREASLTTARVRYLLSTDTYRLDPGLIAGSVRVTLDGSPLDPSSWTVDPGAGTITFSPGVVGPQSDIEVVYRWTPIAGAGREFVGAVGAAVGDEHLGARNLLVLSLPIADAPAPRLGDERPARLADSIDAHAVFGAAPGSPGFHADLRGSAALALVSPDIAGVAIVADMEDDRRIGISLSEGSWSLATPPSILAVPLGTRGDVRYENLREDLPSGGSVLHDISWDNSANPQFDYAEKAGPYNSADSPPDGTSDPLVIDVEFPAPSTDAWAAVSTVMNGIDAGGAERITVWLRAVGIEGDPGQALRVYVEALAAASEDLEDNGVLDGESSASDEGYAITPSDGSPTVLGTDRFGRSNGRLDSEDRNGNGVLDDPASETGVVLAHPVTTWLASFAKGTADSGWIEVSFDISALVAAYPETFRSLRGIRITVLASDDPVTVPATGRILVGGFSFTRSALTPVPSAPLSVREVTPGEDPDLAQHPFAATYPDVYRKLHGSEAYREDHGIADKALAVQVEAPGIAAGTRALLALPVAPPADLCAWKELRVYVLVPAASPPPGDASFVVRLASGSDALETVLPSSAFRVGWNEIAIPLGAGETVTVNGAGAGILAGPSGVVRRVSALQLGLEAGTTAILPSVRFLTDEWHVGPARLALDAAARLDASVGWRGVLAAPGGFPVLADPVLSAWYEHRAGSFLGPYGRVEDAWHADAKTTIAGSLAVSVGAGQSYNRPSQADPDVQAGLQTGSSDLRSLSIVLNTEVPWVPVLEHRWDRSRSREQDPVVATGGLQVAAVDAERESLSVSERLEHEIGLEQWLSFSRTWTRDARELLGASGGSLVDAAGSRGLLEAGQAGVSWSWNGGSVQARAARDRVFAAPDTPVPADGAWSYFQRLAGLFAAPTDALAGAAQRTLRDRIFLELDVPRTSHAGARFTAEAGYTELNVDTATGARDVNVNDLVSLSVPVSPDGGGRLLLTPEVSASFTGAYRGVVRPIREGELLFSPWPGLLLVPLTWSRSIEHDAADPFVDAAGVAAASNTVTGRASLAARMTGTEWYLPTRASVSLKDVTGRDDGARWQQRTVSMAGGKDIPLPAAGKFVVDADGSYGRDFAAKTRSLALSLRSSVQLADVVDGTLAIDQSSGWTRERQAIGDPRLSILPDVPDDPAIVVAPRPDKDTLRNSLAVTYAWSRAGSAYGADIEVRRTTHTERLSVESTIVRVEPGAASSSVPIRLRFEHVSEIEVSDSFTLGISGKAAAGVERRTSAGDDLLLPAIGFEVGITGKIRF